MKKLKVGNYALDLGTFYGKRFKGEIGTIINITDRRVYIDWNIIINAPYRQDSISIREYYKDSLRFIKGFRILTKDDLIAELI